jgi:hypothetical protein
MQLLLLAAGIVWLLVVWKVFGPQCGPGADDEWLEDEEFAVRSANRTSP